MERQRQGVHWRTAWQRHGFTLIELIIIVTILSILAAFAFPRFSTLKVEVRSAATHSLSGHIRSTAALAHALWLAEGQPPVVIMEGARISMVNGYPALASIDDTLSSRNGYSFSADDGVFTRDDSTGICQVDYDEAVVRGTSPEIRLDIAGC